MTAIVATCAIIVSAIGFFIMLGSLNLIDRTVRQATGCGYWGTTLVEGGAITILTDIGIGLMT